VLLSQSLLVSDTLGLLYGAEALCTAAKFRGVDTAQHGRMRHVHRRLIPWRLSQGPTGLRQHRFVELSGRHLYHLAAR